MLRKFYQLIDGLWKEISSIVFVRFAFDIPIDTLAKDREARQIIFSLTSGGIIEWLILSSWCRKNGLGAILISNRLSILCLSKPIDFLRLIFSRSDFSELFNGEETGPRLIFCSPKERKSLFTPTDTENLIATIYTNERSSGSATESVFIPVFICWRKHLRGKSRQLMEYFLGLNSRPNLLGKLWYLFRKRTDSTVKALEPICFSQKESEEDVRDLNDVLEEQEVIKVARKVRRNILVEVNQEMRIVLGPRYVSPHSVKENIMKDPEVFKLVNQISEQTGKDKKKLLAEAYSYLSEIAANYSFRFIEVMYVLLTWVFGKIFEEIVVEPSQLQRLREILKTKSAVFISCHRSHLDYMVVPGVLFLDDIITPHIAAGVNLSFWPVGHFLRKGGAFFIRRSFRGQPLYALCLQKYIDWLITNRINIKFFIEGTRSRTGKMLPPAFGLLKMVVQPYQAGLIDDLALVPISISYDEVLEEKSYVKELSGGDKAKESTRGLVRARKLLKRNIGKVYVRFAEPLSLKEEFNFASTESSRSDHKIEKLAIKVCKKINDVTPVTPKSILASVLLSVGRNAISREEILATGEILANYAKWTQIELCKDSKDESIRASLETHLDKIIRNNLVVEDENSPDRFLVQGRNRINLVFYKNNSIHCFVIPSIALLSKLQGSDRTLENAFLLRSLLKFEFFFSPSKIFSHEISQSIDWLSDQGPQMSVFSQLNRDLFESYLFAFEVVKNLGERTEAQKVLLQMIVRNGIEKVESDKQLLPESISTQTFSNALKFLELLKVVSFVKERDQTFVRMQDWNAQAEKALSDLKGFHELMIRA